MRPLVEVAPGVLVATAQTWQTTSTVVVADGGCLVVDPAVTVAEVDGLAGALAARGTRVEAGFATHPHWDHVLWSTGLGDVPRWATAEACRIVQDGREALLRDAEADAPGHDPGLIGRLTPLPDEGATVPWPGPRTVVVPHRAHCPGSAALVVPERRVLCAGDLLSDREVPLLDLDVPDPVGEHLRALDLLEAALDEHAVRAVVPGHGTVTDPSGARRRADADRAYLSALVSGAPVVDGRLDDPWVAAQHERQAIWASGGREPAP